jgi:hypothetical protein
MIGYRIIIVYRKVRYPRLPEDLTFAFQKQTKKSFVARKMERAREGFSSVGPGGDHCIYHV